MQTLLTFIFNLFLSTLHIFQMGIAEGDVGFVVGVIQGCYSLAQFISSFGLGHTSDKLGRKPVMIIGIFF